MIVVVMGVAGAGKTTVGTMLAAAMNCPFLEGDALHPASNVEKMIDGIPLTDTDRAPWLDAIHARLVDAFTDGQSLVVACSALKHSYRTTLAEGVPVVWVWLKGAAGLIRSRLEQRAGHYMKMDMLAGQLDALEPPADAIIVDVAQPPGAIIEKVLRALRERNSRRDVRVFADADELSLRAAGAVVATLDDAIRNKGKCSMVLSGGSTPRILYSLLATRFRDRIPWAHVRVFWADERYVPHHHADSNYGMASTILLDHVPCPAANVHPMPTDRAIPDHAARDYEATLRRHLGETPRFDLLLLGLGSDGHTASLFPGAPALGERTRWVVEAAAPVEPRVRLTLTLPALTRSATTYFLVTGSDKAPALHRVLDGTADASACPAAAVARGAGSVVWWVDRDAAARLDD